jgi:ribosomal protein L10
VQELVDLMVNSHVVGVVDLHGIPAAQMISMRAVLRGKADVNMTRNTLMDLPSPRPPSRGRAWSS